MLEYIFFHRPVLDEMISRLEDMSIQYKLVDDDMGLIVSVSEDIDDEMIDQIDEFYEKLMEKSEALQQAEDDAEHKHIAGISIQLKNGCTVVAAVRPELINKVLEVVTFQELNELVEAIAQAVEQEDSRPLCQR